MGGGGGHSRRKLGQGVGVLEAQSGTEQEGRADTVGLGAEQGGA